jgi:hypothetical protein
MRLLFIGRARSQGCQKRNATTPGGLPARGPRSWAGIGERFQRYIAKQFSRQSPVRYSEMFARIVDRGGVNYDAKFGSIEPSSCD